MPFISLVKYNFNPPPKLSEKDYWYLKNIIMYKNISLIELIPCERIISEFKEDFILLLILLPFSFGFGYIVENVFFYPNYALIFYIVLPIYLIVSEIISLVSFSNYRSEWKYYFKKMEKIIKISFDYNNYLFLAHKDNLKNY